MARPAKAVSAHDLIGRHVFILNVRFRDRLEQDPLPFAELHTLERHVCDLISRYLSFIDDKHRSKLIAALEAQHFHRAISIFREAQLVNREAIPVDFLWREEASVIM